jgi:phosphatidylserine/phosphatidylglycerophosphate/cardiolipin synthase-like enzyme
MLLLAATTACAHPDDEARPPKTEDPSGSIRLILNAPFGDAPADACAQEHCRALLELIDGAERTIDFAIYGIRNQTAIQEAMQRAKARGVDIRGVVDRDHEGKNYYSSTDAFVQAMGAVRDDEKSDRARAKKERRETPSARPCNPPMGFAGPVQCLAYDLGDRCLMAAHASEEPIEGSDAIMHDKFFVVDGRFVWTGSTNVSDSCSGGYNANLVTVIDSRRVADAYRREFEQMYEDGRFHEHKTSRGRTEVELGNARVEVMFAPQDTPIRERMRPLVQGARERIDVAVFYLTHKHLTGDLIEAHLRGVKIRVIIDATSAVNGYTKHELLRAVGIPVKVENWGGKMHMKSAMIDGRTVITGSENWTTAGDDTNDENVVIVHSAQAAAQYEKFFDELWASIPDRWLEGAPAPESKDSGSACGDGVDNDYDDQTDAEDAGCSDQPPPPPKMPPWWIKPKDRLTCEW